MDIQKAKELLQKYQSGNYTSSEKELVEKWYQRLVDTGEFQWEEGEENLRKLAIKEKLLEQLNHLPDTKKVRVFVMPRLKWWAAASVILLLGIFSYFMFLNNRSDSGAIVKSSPAEVKAPESNRAVITLSDGQKIYLDSAGNGALAVQGNVQLLKLPGGEIAYQTGSGQSENEIEYNTIVNPRGSKVVNMVLTDGSKVWLNAGSSLKYPVTFLGDQRKVTVEGEAYFEVAPNVLKPFFVRCGTIEVQVLGTHFNVNAFEDDDDNTKITLLEGSVKVRKGGESGLLEPGQQAQVNKEIRVVSNIDIAQVMAWKNGYFQFDKASLQSFLKQISRWYDVDVVYEGNNKSREFVGEMERDLSLSTILEVLQMNNVEFTIENKKIIIRPD